LRLRAYFSKVAIKFRTLWKYYIYQSLLAAAVMLIVFLILTENYPVIIASIGATAFIVFAMPKYVTAEPMRVIGGHFMGIISGSLFSFIPPLPTTYSLTIYSALAVALSIFLMVVLDMEHPPASGTALGIALKGFNITVVITVIVSVILLSVAHYLLKRFLKDLT